MNEHRQTSQHFLNSKMVNSEVRLSFSLIHAREKYQVDSACKTFEMHALLYCIYNFFFQKARLRA
jgi:hypothetical protein